MEEVIMPIEIGQRFGLLVVLKNIGNIEYGKTKRLMPAWECECDCGNKKIIAYPSLTGSRTTKSCGCLRKKERPNRKKGDIRIGEVHRQFNGMDAVIINYNTVNDITIQFENGVIVNNVKYDNLIRNKVKCPMIVEEIDDILKVINSNTHPETIFFVDMDFKDLVSNDYWHNDSNGYVKSNKHGHLHRLIMNAQKGDYVDHINGNTADNRRSNLRLCSNAKNVQNSGMRKNNKS